MRRRARWTVWALLPVVFALTACEEGGGSGQVVYDTIGGVPAVLNPARGTVSDSLAWDFAQYILLAGDQLYDGVPTAFALDAGILPGGGVVVLDAGNHRVLRFDPDGAYLDAFGGEGEGPGELLNPFFLSVADTLIYVLDPGNNRISAYDSAGSFIRDFEINLGGLAGTTPVFATGGPDEIYLYGEPVPFMRGAQDTGMAVLHRLDRTGTIVDTVATRPPSRWTRIMRPDSSFSYAKPRLAPEPRVAAAPGLVAVSFVAEYIVELRRPDGNLERRVTKRYENAPVTEQVRDSVIDRLVQGPSRLPREALEQVPFAPVIPAIEDLVVDDRGQLWVDPFIPEAPNRWDVFDPDGRYMGPVYLPQTLRVAQVRGDRLCGVMQAVSGQAAVSCYRITR